MLDLKFHCNEDWAFEHGFLARAFTYMDYSIELHTHDFYEINVVLSGNGIHHIEDGRIEVTAGDVFVIPPMIAHAYTNTEKLNVYHILLEKSFFETNKEARKTDGFLQLTEIEPFLRSGVLDELFLHLNFTQLDQFKNEIAIIDDEGEYSWQSCHLLKYHTIWKILFWFSSLLSRQLSSKELTAKKKYSLQIIGTLEFIHENYDQKITIDTLCHRVYLSRSTFLREFKAICGVSPMEYLNTYRCKKAIELLSLGVHSKTEVAHACGFYDLSHMEKMLSKNKKG